MVTTVRSQEKADRIQSAFSQYVDSNSLSFAIVPDIAAAGAFDAAVVSDPPFDLVLHTASPFHFNTKDSQKDLLDPAINGTTGILKAIAKSAPHVKRVVITSSFAAIVDAAGKPAGYVYSEKDWNPITAEQAVANAGFGYRASKTFAERAAWEFVAKEKPGFDLVTINPPLVFGPVIHHLSSLSSLNTSNELLRDIIQGKYQAEGLPRAGVFFWVDVRDLADAHVHAAERKEAGGKRFFVTAGDYSNEEVGRIVQENFSEYKDKVGDLSKAGYGEGRPKFDNKQSLEVLGIKYRTLEESIVDTVKSLKDIPA